MAEPENKDGKFLASKLKNCFFSSLLHSWEEAEGGEEQIRACHLGSVAARGGGRGKAKLGLILPPGRHGDTATSPGFRKKLETLGRATPKHPKGDQAHLFHAVCFCCLGTWRFVWLQEKRNGHCCMHPWPFLSSICKVEIVVEEIALSH